MNDIVHQDAPSILALRYEYILREKSALNSRSFGVLGLFQSITTSIVGGVLAVFSSWRALEIAPDQTKTVIYVLLTLQFLVSAYAILSLIAGIRTWAAYKTEENAILRKTPEAVSLEARTSPAIWFESYMLAFVVVVTLFVFFIAVAFVLPKVVA